MKKISYKFECRLCHYSPYTKAEKSNGWTRPSLLKIVISLIISTQRVVTGGPGSRMGTR